MAIPVKKAKRRPHHPTGRRLCRHIRIPSPIKTNFAEWKNMRNFAIAKCPSCGRAKTMQNN